MDFLHRNVNTLFQHYIGQSPENQHVISISQLVKFAVSSDLCIEWASNRMVVPRAALLITHVKGLEGDMELVPREREREELSCQQPACCYSDDKYQNLVRRHTYN